MSLSATARSSDAGGAYEIIDGLQRLHTLVSFIEYGFPSIEGSFFNVSQFPTAQARYEEEKFAEPYSDTPEFLTNREITTYLDYSLAISVMRGATEAEIDDVFARINTFGHRLSDQERRQAGVQDDFSTLVRELACDSRGDASSDILDLAKMPSISVDLPMTRHGYDVVADQVFWVDQGVLRSTDLRDSMDEQCLADVIASIVGGVMIDRSKDALDRIYAKEDEESSRITAALDVYGSGRIASEIKFCIDELLAICNADGSTKLRNIVFKKTNSGKKKVATPVSTNPFPSAFAILLVALHECLIEGSRKVANYAGAKAALAGVYGRIDTSRGSTAPSERRKNVDIVKGLLNPHLVATEPREIYDAHTSTDIDAIIHRSEIELPHYELKQGMLTLGSPRVIDSGAVEKIIRTICAIANNGFGRTGAVIIGVADKASDADRVKELDHIEPRKVAGRFVVGLRREASWLQESFENYFARWKNAIRNSSLSNPLKDQVLSGMDSHDYYGLGVIVIKIPAQKEPSYVDGKAYWRSGDETWEAADAKKIVEIGSRFN